VTLPGSTVAALAVDAAGHAYLTGTTTSPNFPVTAGTYQNILYVPAPNNPGQAFAMKLNPDGKIAYGTYLGGHSTTTGKDIVVDSAGEGIVSGSSWPGPFPVTAGAVDNSDYNLDTGFVLKLDATGS